LIVVGPSSAITVSRLDDRLACLRALIAVARIADTGDREACRALSR